MIVHVHKDLLRTYYVPSLLLNPDVCVSCKGFPKFKMLSIILYFKKLSNSSLLPTPPRE